MSLSISCSPPVAVLRAPGHISVQNKSRAHIHIHKHCPVPISKHPGTGSPCWIHWSQPRVCPTYQEVGASKKRKKKKEKMYCVLTCQHLRQVNLLKYSAAAGATADKARPAARFTTEASTSPATRRAASQLLCFQYFKSDICFLIVFCAYASMQRGESTSVHPVLSRVIDFHFSNREIFFPWILCYYSRKKMTHAGKTPLPLIFFYNIP